MNRSDSIKELASALVKAQAAIEGATKSQTNDHFHSKYADLASCWGAARKPLTDNGLSVMQFARLVEIGVEVETMMTHTSGEFVSETLTMPLSKRDAHGVGSAITYCRRFGFCAMVGIAPEDDDGNKASEKDKADGNDAKTTLWPKDLTDKAKAAAALGGDGYRAFWKALPEPTRSALVDTPEHSAFKRNAADVDAKKVPELA